MNKKIMKRSLALGALMAFVITGSAWAAEDKIAEGESLTVSSGAYDKIIGGKYLKYINENQVVNLDKTNIVFQGDSAEEVIGGTRLNQVLSAESTIKTTNLTILGGRFGSNPSGNVPSALIVGGDNLKLNNSATSSEFAVESSIESTNLTIQGGEFNSLVLGGSSVIKYYGNGSDDDKNGYVKAHVDTANTIISGGTFEKHIIAAGGLAVSWVAGAESTVGTANLKIENSDVGVNIYAGGVLQKNGIVGVTKANISIKDSTVRNIYGSNAILSQPGDGQLWQYAKDSSESAIVNTALSLTNVIANDVEILKGSVSLRVEDSENVTGKTYIATLTTGDSVVTNASANGAVNDAVGGDLVKAGKRIKIADKAIVNDDGSLNKVSSFTLEEGEVAAETTVDENGVVTKKPHQGNAGIKDIAAIGLMSWRNEMNDMNKRLGELRNANGEHGVWVRMVRGETEYNSVKNQYNQYQLGYDEKLSADPSWTVGFALSYTEADNNFSKGSGESTNKAFSIYGSKLNEDGTFIDLIGKVARLENDFDLGDYKGDYDSHGYSLSAEYGKRIQQDNGLWIEPQVELTYGTVDSATYMVGGRTVNQDSTESLVGRIGFSLGKDIKDGNVYARASYLYDFEGETSATFSKGAVTDSFKQDLGGGWWEVGVGANINLSKATYIYADVEKTFGGEVDTNWQWNLGVRYSF